MVQNMQLTYLDLTERKAGKRMLLPLEQWPSKVDWFRNYQIKKKLKWIAKNIGLKKQDSSLESILLKGENKIVSKIYKLLITWFTKEEVVKEVMIKWTINYNKTQKWDHGNTYGQKCRNPWCLQESEKTHLRRSTAGT